MALCGACGFTSLSSLEKSRYLCKIFLTSICYKDDEMLIISDLCEPAPYQFFAQSLAYGDEEGKLHPAATAMGGGGAGRRRKLCMSSEKPGG